MQAVLMPLAFFLCIMAFALWVHARTRNRSRSRGDMSGGVSVPFGPGGGFGSSGD